MFAPVIVPLTPLSSLLILSNLLPSVIIPSICIAVLKEIMKKDLPTLERPDANIWTISTRGTWWTDRDGLRIDTDDWARLSWKTSWTNHTRRGSLGGVSQRSGGGEETEREEEIC